MKDRYVSRYIYIYMYGGCCLRLCVSYAGLEQRQASCGYGEFERSKLIDIYIYIYIYWCCC